LLYRYGEALSGNPETDSPYLTHQIKQRNNLEDFNFRSQAGYSR